MVYFADVVVVIERAALLVSPQHRVHQHRWLSGRCVHSKADAGSLQIVIT